jgi:hypothetical protein
MPMLATFGAGSARAFGFGVGGAQGVAAAVLDRLAQILLGIIVAEMVATV